MLYFITISSTLVIFSTVCLQEKATEWFRWFRSSCFPAQAITRCSFSLKHNLSCISLNFLTLISENFWILLAVWWLWNLRIPPKWQAGNKRESVWDSTLACCITLPPFPSGLHVTVVLHVSLHVFRKLLRQNANKADKLVSLNEPQEENT